MTAATVALGLAGAIFIASPGLAEVSEAARKACETKADQHQPMLNAVDREAFIANCLADASVDE
jgi:hypothetical protein